ncbi:hypothetical protein LOTGIDRAFT_161139 [Lottia gigantea]|uniref:Nucleolar protein 4 n=1 Tax=Lottia gigantea TaxID=225164 RepID=V4BZ86_LOTGI|nr:hypothetical protein LOTGIDRAFT_161139 [Lottia gigantea]ESO94449.1 hypothetical protein LOTGIDRAFT_161139 [Lottia gigantea]
MSSSARNEESSACISEADKLEMFETFQSWAIKNYGDSGKTKTVTRKKYDRITNILSGEEQSTSENSKFRFWVKAKGFRLSCEIEKEDEPEPFLEVPSKTTGTCILPNHFIMGCGEGLYLRQGL